MGQVEVSFIYEDTIMENGVLDGLPFIAFKSKNEKVAKGFAPTSITVCKAIRSYVTQMEKYLEGKEDGKIQSTKGERKDPNRSWDNKRKCR
jgi:hypothetical protein